MCFFRVSVVASWKPIDSVDVPKIWPLEMAWSWVSKFAGMMWPPLSDFSVLSDLFLLPCITVFFFSNVSLCHCRCRFAVVVFLGVAAASVAAGVAVVAAVVGVVCCRLLSFSLFFFLYWWYCAHSDGSFFYAATNLLWSPYPRKPLDKAVHLDVSQKANWANCRVRSNVLGGLSWWGRTHIWRLDMQDVFWRHESRANTIKNPWTVSHNRISQVTPDIRSAQLQGQLSHLNHQDLSFWKTWPLQNGERGRFVKVLRKGSPFCFRPNLHMKTWLKIRWCLSGKVS